MSKPSAALRFLYRTVPGRCLLWLLVRPWLSKGAGALLSTRLSRLFVPLFVKSKGMDLSEYPVRAYDSFNDFFTRTILPGKRAFSPAPEALCSPADGWVSVYRADDTGVFSIKNSLYRVRDLLDSDELARRFRGGTLLVVRLCVDDYHRYAWFDGGIPQAPVFIPGELHTVQPIAFEKYPVFVRNSREYTIIDTDRFGTAAQVEVGALMVGRIANHPITGRVQRGQEKGMFLFGGSTVVLILEKDAARIHPDFWEATARGEEVRVKQGQTLGRAH